MSVIQLMVTAGGVITIGFLAGFFFHRTAEAAAAMSGGVQEATVVVHGGYQSNLLRAQTGSPLRLRFDRREDGDCSARGDGTPLGVVTLGAEPMDRRRTSPPTRSPRERSTMTRLAVAAFLIAHGLVHLAIYVSPRNPSKAAPSTRPGPGRWPPGTSAPSRCAARVWLFKGLGGPGALSDEAVQLCHDNKIDVVAGACPLMSSSRSAGSTRCIAHAPPRPRVVGEAMATTPPSPSPSSPPPSAR